MIQVQHTWFPLVDRNPNKFMNIYEAKAEDFIPNTHTLYVDGDKSSSIKVKVLK